MILVDPPVWRARERVWSHLASDTSYDELHDFAERVGLHPFSYDGDHYDVPADRYDEVVAAGAVPTSARELLRAISAAGLRFRKRRGERPVAALPNGLRRYLPVEHRLDLVLSGTAPPPASTIAVVTFVFDDAGHLLLLHSPRRSAWEGPGGWVEPGERAWQAAAREVAEETGLRLADEQIEPCGYERIHLYEEHTHGYGAGRLLPTSHIALFQARATGRAPTSDAGPEGHPLAWCDPLTVQSRCGDAAWWPILARLLRADGSQTWRARSVT
ncbi:MAG: DUF4031 domain-containing protein [Mobilicoccus sp.]|nr:DUF4031 domain-containing protein [Mobilicoccus sp.]